MSNVVAAMSISVDGFVGASDPEQWFPVHNRVHDWVFELAAWRERQGMTGGRTSVSSDLVAEEFAGTGAYVMGRSMFDFGEEPWGEEPPFHAPVFVVTHRKREPLHRVGTTFTFVTEGLESAVEQAADAAGERDVFVSGGASIVQQAIAAGLLDELHLHQVPVLLGAGVRLWDHIGTGWKELEPTRITPGDGVTHLYYRFPR
ncbi:dihydrofolate reductase [Actinoplanes campanulatus]|uniref:Dihydrofolate reductase n=1 Tax=Actinoplanes campanulatus TaxID=113559 RepID=A0A7W5ALS8_9ACTN|nr:dihydrofolate reductase family protein [Actinoplanes campanulatus]MBB3098407.1 dihydrofolate reductase [Actinoplanes campanulatus]GGN35090.1 deaminase reductase [Actinoplanes campanulatus]GID39100.1 deaminase reductase [Actinoplanes campanulatus]